MSAGRITTQARAVQVHRCHCGTDRLPTLQHLGGKARLVRYACGPCGATGVKAINPERAAKNWNADMAARRAA